MTLPVDAILTTLQRGKIVVQGEFLWGSNYTFLVKVEHASSSIAAVYKPTRGERPLWDFPTATLARREVAAYLLSEALEWQLVPPTIYRKKGPMGPGSLQFFIDHDPDAHYFNFPETIRQRLRPVVLFDILINNADRKGSHILVAKDDHLWLIDHGICFHVEDKLRTVIWDFVGEPIPENLCADISNLRKKLYSPENDLETNIQPDLFSMLQEQLSQDEIQAIAARAETLITANIFPPPNPYRRPYPWPQI